jgi:two-component system LytT family response regulator
LPPSAVVVDDDPLARERLKDLNEDAALVEIVGEAADGPSAIELIDRLKPDIVFMDIEIPVFSGLQVLERIAHRPAVIFTTAYGHYAVRAFELAAVDYLLKPFGRERLSEAVARLTVQVSETETDSTLERARAALRPAEEPPNRIFIRDRDAIVPVSVAAIVRFEADGDYVRVHTRAEQHMMRIKLQDLEESLGDQFLRVHRSHLLNLAHVVKFESHDATRLAAIMADGSRVVASRSRSQTLKRLAH